MRKCFNGLGIYVAGYLESPFEAQDFLYLEAGDVVNRSTILGMSVGIIEVVEEDQSSSQKVSRTCE